MIEKFHKRIIPEYRADTGDSFRVKFGDRNGFDVLVVSVIRELNNETLEYRFASKSLPASDSIHFTTQITNGKLQVRWKGGMIPISGSIISSSIENATKTTKKVTEDSAKVPKSKEIISFPPVINEKCKLLILGTMPGEESLRKSEYYANPRNIFWPMMFKLSGSKPVFDYETKKKVVLDMGIALWDVCKACLRDGSLDSAIEDEIPNEINNFLLKYPSITTIAFNGQKAAAIYDKHFSRKEGIQYLTLPSTSPANASISLSEKQNEWNSIKRHVFIV